MGPKRSLEMNFSKKAIIPPGDKKFWPVFTHIIERDKGYGTVYKGT